MTVTWMLLCIIAASCFHLEFGRVQTGDLETIGWRKSQQKKNRRKSNLAALALRQEWQRRRNEQLRLEIPKSTLQSLASMVFYNFTTAAVPVSAYEANKTKPCSFLFADCTMELLEQEAVEKFIKPSDSVLELGARYGTTSCAIAHRLKNSGRLVSVEPDKDIWNILAFNQVQHHCAFWTWRGVVANSPVVLSQAEYATRATTVLGSASGRNREAIPFLSFEALQSTLGIFFNSILIDCEGCIDQLFAISPNGGSAQRDRVADMLANVTTIILEADMKINSPFCQQDCVDYDKWFAKFRALGFKMVHKKVDTIFSSIDHVVFVRNLGE